MGTERAGYVQNYIDERIAAALTAGHTISRIDMTAGAQEMLRLRYFPESRKPKPDGGICRYRGFPVKTARLDVPAIVHAHPRMPKV